MKSFINVLVSVALLGVLVFATRPNVEAPWTLLLFFAAYLYATYSIGLVVVKFLRVQARQRFIAAIIAILITTLQVLLTFNALRPLEVILMAVVITLGAWYFSHAKS